jgi:DNA end-binding protein Ku
MDEPQLEATPPASSIWTGWVSVGLINVPVKLYTMVRDVSVSFKLLRREDSCPLEYQRVCSLDGEVVPWSEVVKGYEVGENKYIIFEQETLDRLRPRVQR